METKNMTKRSLRRAHEREGPRVKCWCGSGRRYIRCHGDLPEQRELAVLGLDPPSALADALGRAAKRYAPPLCRCR